VVAAPHARLYVIHAECVRGAFGATVHATVAVTGEHRFARQRRVPRDLGSGALACSVTHRPAIVKIPDPMRRHFMTRLTRFLDPDEAATAVPGDLPPRLTHTALEALRMSRSRDRILTNLEEMYSEAFARAKEVGDEAQMASLDFAYRREQLYFEILLDVRDAVEKR
jgi:hypothetical protein